MDIYGIASASMAMSQMQLQQGVAVAVTKKAIDAQETDAAALLEMLPPSTNLLDAYC